MDKVHILVRPICSWRDGAEVAVDLTRYLSTSPVISDSIHVHTVEHSDEVGKLSQQKFVEDDLVTPELRVPRITNATWRTENGGTASFVHGVVLHGPSSHLGLEGRTLIKRGRLRLRVGGSCRWMEVEIGRSLWNGAETIRPPTGRSRGR